MKKSYFYPVENKDAYRTATKQYYLAKTEAETYLFTDADLDKASERAQKNPEDIPSDEEFLETKRPWLVISILGNVALATGWLLSHLLY